MTSDLEDYNPHQYNFAIARQDGILVGKELMKQQVLAVLATMKQTQPMERLTQLIKKIEVSQDE
jgi:hypothetical protein